MKHDNKSITAASTFAIALLVALAWPGASACGRSDDLPPAPAAKAGELTDPSPSVDTQDGFERERTEFVTATDQRVEQLGQRIDRLENDLGAMGEDAKQSAQAKLAYLRAQQTTARASLDRARHATADEWNDLKQSTRDHVSALERGYNELLESMKTE